MTLSHQLATGPTANIEGLVQVGEFGVEREVRQKNAGLRTHSLVGVAAALFMLASKYGVSDSRGADEARWPGVRRHAAAGIGWK